MNFKFVPGLLFFFLFFLRCALWANIDLKYQQKIESSCKNSSVSSHRKKKQSNDICGCIAKMHFLAAQKEPVEAEAIKQLLWVIDYYKTTDQKKLNVLSLKPENLVEYDLMVIEDCQKSTAIVK